MTDGAHDHAALAPTALVLSETSARQQGDTALQAAIDALTARVAKLEAPVAPPVVTPITQLPPQVVSGPLNFTYDGQTIQNVIIDGPHDTAANQAAASPTSGIYGKGRKDCRLSNVTVRGRSWGVLLIDMVGFIGTDVTATDLNYCAFGIFGGSNGQLIRPTAQRVGMLRDSAGNPTIGDVANCYGFMFSVASQAGGSSGIPNTWLIDHGLVEDVPFWQGYNAHDGAHITIQDSIARRCQRAYFMAGSTISSLSLLRNQALEMNQKGPINDPEGIMLSGVQGAQLVGNQISKTYGPPSTVWHDEGGNTGVVSSGNVVVV